MTGTGYSDVPRVEFAFPGALRDQLVAAILAGEKTATTGLLVDYERGAEPLPVVGARSVVVDSEERPVAVIEVTAVRVVPLAEVDWAHVRDEGEGHRSVAEWRAGHERFWHGPDMRAELGDPEFTVTDATPVVLERFRLLERLPPAGPTEPELLPGGFVNHVVRVGATVRRPPSERAAFVRDLLALFERHGWTGAPRFRGLDEEGREILDYLDGHVPWRADQGAGVRSDAGLVRVAELVREFHDLTSGTPLAGEHEVVSHNDLSPRNTVYTGGDGRWHPVAFIDWDIAAPGERAHDVAHVCWQYLDLGPGVTNVPDAARRIRLLCDAYGALAAERRRRIVDVILWWQDRCWRGIEAAAERGEPAMVRLRDTGASRAVRAAHDWVAEHRHELGAALD